MRVGLLDYDLAFPAGKAWFPSLELMKYSTYYKSRNDLVYMVYDLTNLNFYDIIIIRADHRNQIIPTKLLTLPSVEWIGDRFSEGVFIPPPLEVSNMYPDKSIYFEAIEGLQGTISKRRRDSYHLFLNNDCVRFLDRDNKINFQAPKFPSKTLIIYDKDLFQKNRNFIDFWAQNYKENYMYFVSQQEVSDLYTFKKIREELHYRDADTNNPSLLYTGKLRAKDIQANPHLFNSNFRCVCYCDKSSLNFEGQVLTFKHYLNLYLLAMSLGGKIFFWVYPKGNEYQRELASLFYSFSQKKGLRRMWDLKGPVLMERLKKAASADLQLNALLKTDCFRVKEIKKWEYYNDWIRN